ncbi:hypothetical protein U1Q18_037755 [Sarracenia purpurea var. burkii]
MVLSMFALHVLFCLIYIALRDFGMVELAPKGWVWGIAYSLLLAWQALGGWVWGIAYCFLLAWKALGGWALPAFAMMCWVGGGALLSPFSWHGKLLGLGFACFSFEVQDRGIACSMLSSF